ncbi:MAG TPA: hypothetical protein VM099_14440 [Gemmatimonadaceae bacterium]|nr:hypothetical protein [Gemmatimonadaceae bacterium]
MAVATEDSARDLPERTDVREYIEHDPHTDAVGRSPFGAWVGFLLPPAIAVGNLQFGFVLGHIACQTGSKIGVHIYMFVCLVLTLIGGFLAWREWTFLGEERPGQARSAIGSRRFLGLAGMMGAALSAYIVLAQWLPAFVLAPCMRT